MSGAVPNVEETKDTGGPLITRRETLDLGKSIYWNDEVKIRIEAGETGGKFVNEFKVLELIGRGAYSKVKRVVRQYSENGENYEEVYAMKVSFQLIKQVDDA